MTKETAQFLLGILSQITINPMSDEALDTVTLVKQASTELQEVLKGTPNEQRNSQ